MQHHGSFDCFVETIRRLFAEDGCPWDREQTHASIAPNMLEEAYEAVDAIEKDDMAHLREELGDVLLQVIMQARMAENAGEFTLDEVIEDIDAKIVRRHPHVFGAEAALGALGLDLEVEDASDVEEVWAQVKAYERSLKPEKESLLDAVPSSQAALSQAQAISEKAVKAGFEWETVEDVWDKVQEEIGEFKASAPGSKEAELEFGDILFCLVNVARKEGIDAESALRACCNKFRRRWASMEDQAVALGMKLEEMDQPQQEVLWQEAKKDE